MNYYLTCLLLLATFVGFAQHDDATQSEWDFVAEKTNIKVYTRTTETSDIKELRILADFDGQIDTLLNILNDANNYGTWVYKCSKSEPIIPGEGYNTAYSAITDFPFPMSDRELVAKSNQYKDEYGRLIQHTVNAGKDIPEKSGVVRIKNYEAKWIMEQIDTNRIHVEYVSSVDPGGNIPAWVVNLALTTGPIKTFEKLMKQVGERSSVLDLKALR